MNTKKMLLSASAVVAAGVVAVVAAHSVLAYQGDPTKKGPNYTAERHEAMEQAFEKKDYNAWVQLMQGRGRMTSVVTEANFPKFAEAHELAEQGKYSEADAIRKELGLRVRNGEATQSHFGQGMGRGRMMQ